MPTVLEHVESRRLDRCSEVEIVLHPPDGPLLLSGHQADHRSGGAGPSGASRPVQVVLVVARGIEVDHRRDRIDMDAPRGHVGCDQCLGAAGRKRLESPGSLVLGASAVHGNRTDPQLLELLGEPVGTVAGTGEHDGAASRLDQVRGVLNPVMVLHQPEVVPGIDRFRVHCPRLMADGIPLIGAAQHRDIAIEGR